MNRRPAGQTSTSVLDLIRGWKWFRHVPPEAHAWLAERATLVRMPQGRMVYVAGDEATAIYAVAGGAFRIYLTSARGDEITLEEVAPGGWFPHLPLDDKLRYRGNCVCVQDATVAVVPFGVMAEFGQRWPGYFRGLYTEFTDRLDVILGRIELLSVHSLHVRMAVYLLRMAHLRGAREPGGAILVASDTQAEIGARVGGTRQYVNSILKTWSKKGLIEVTKDYTRILDLRRLTAEAKKSGFDVDGYLAGWHGGWGKR